MLEHTAMISGIETDVAAAATFDIRPPAGEAYCLITVGSQHAWITPGDIPDVQISLSDVLSAAVPHAICPVRIDPTTDPQKNRDLELYITNDVYATITNTGAINADIAWCAWRVDPNRVASQIVTVPASARADIQPDVGQVLRITEIGAETYGPSNHPDVTVFLTDGVLVASMLITELNDIRQECQPNWFITDTLYLQMLEMSAADCDFAVSAWVEDKVFRGAIMNILGATVPNWDIQPADGEEVVITTFAAETWTSLGAVGAPIESPDVTYSLYDGVDPSTIIEAGSVTAVDSPKWNNPMKIMLNNALYLRMTDVSGGDNECAYSGYVLRRYNP